MFPPPPPPPPPPPSPPLRLQVIESVKREADLRAVRGLSLELRRHCAAIRASVETHIRSEEAELWPLFRWVLRGWTTVL